MIVIARRFLGFQEVAKEIMRAYRIRDNLLGSACVSVSISVATAYCNDYPALFPRVTIIPPSMRVLLTMSYNIMRNIKIQ